MKKNFLFMSVLAALLMAGCSKEESAPNGGDDGNGGANTSYLSVNLISSDNVSRAAENYEDGTSDENKVTSVRFYFFNGSGSAVDVKLKGNQYVNYYDWDPKSGDQKDDNNDTDYIESVLNATIVINTATGDRIPQRIAAILNPSTATLGDGSKGLDDLKKICRDYAASNLTESGKFVMFNAVYADGNTYFSSAPITAGNLCKDAETAKEHPVTIKVERNVAKVKVTLDSSIGFTDGKLLLKDKDDNPILVKNKQVYLKLNGWDLTAEAKNTRLVKKINPAWGGGNWWDGGDRTFWAINVPKEYAGNNYYDYDAIKNPFLTDENKPFALYTNENAENDSETTMARTKVIISGTLCDENGNSFTIARHMGAYYADSYDKDDETNNLTVLKTSILGQLSANGHHYYYADGSARKPITVSDLEIVIAGQQNTEDSKNNCYVYAQLTADAAKKTWYNTDTQGATSIVPTVINTALENKDVVDRALVWNEGKTYYYYEIKHLQDNIGVVRNHIYDTKVTKIAGLGTPVYDPDQVIYPEKPNPNDHYIAAEIKILSWRIVNNEYKLEW